MPESEFCGDQLWDWELTWALNNRTLASDYYGPDFTACFQATVLVWIPCAFIWILGAPFEILSNWGRDKLSKYESDGQLTPDAGVEDEVYVNVEADQIRHRIPWTKLNVTKFGLGALLFVLHVLLLVDLKSESVTKAESEPFGEGSEPVVYMGPIYSQLLRIMTLILAEFLLLHGKYIGIRSSGPQFLFWTLTTVCEAFPFRTAILKLSYGHEQALSMVVIRLAIFPVTGAIFLLNCWADGSSVARANKNANRQPPEATASFLSRITFSWVEPMLLRGFRTPLDFPDLWELPDEDKSNNYMDKFQAYWKRKRYIHVKDEAKGRRQSQRSRGSARSHVQEIRERDSSLLGTLWHVFRRSFLVGAFFKLLHDCMIFVPPQILSLLVAFVVNGEETWKGVTYVVLLLTAAALQSIFLAQYFHRMFITAMRTKATIMSAIYRKALLVSNSARKESTVGEIVNLMSVDVQNVTDLIPFVNLLWSAPFQICLSLYFLWQTLGYSVLAGVALLLCLVPINAMISSRVKRLQMRQMKTKDQRVKLMNEILNGIKVLKMYAWEPSLQQEVLRIRDQEMDILKLSVYFECFMSFVMHCSPFVVALFTAGTYVLVDSSHVFDSSKAFVSLTLFNIMRTPLKMLPMVISNTVKASVSLHRLKDFLNAEEIPVDGVSHLPSVEYPIVIQNATFCWEEDVEVLRNINLHIKQGSLTAIVGPVGAGKSSLLAAMLGELPHAGGRLGHVNTRGSIAYVAQQAWIQGASLQNNILFGRRMEEARYGRVLDACALRPDLAILPAGDQTEIGEKGINLSGGQKQRVALARAAYNDADIYLLDDPLSAVDSHVGKHIFENVLGPKGLLRGKTRVLVTHGLTHLPLMDKIVVLDDGEIVESGSYEELLAKKGDFADFLLQYAIGENSRGGVIGVRSELLDEEALIIKELQKAIESKPKAQRRLSRALSGISAAFSTASSVRPRGRGPDSNASAAVSVTGTPVRIPQQIPRLFYMEPLFLHSPDSDEALAPDSKVDARRRRGSDLQELEGASTLVCKEAAETGSVKSSVYLHYIHSVGVLLFAVTIGSNFLSQAFEVSSNVWLAEWSSNARARGVDGDNSTEQQAGSRIASLGTYAGLGLGQAIFLILGSVSMAQGLSNASNFLHSEMLARILRAPMSFFDQTPTGRIVNRFGKDVDVVDSVLPLNFRDLLFCTMNVLTTLLVICVSIPAFIILLLPIGLLYWLVQRYYIESSRQLKRMEAVSRSPIYSHFSETITGLATIRGFGAQARFTTEFEAKVDRNHAAALPFIVANRWLSIRLESIANLVTFSSAMLAVVLVDRMDAGFVGLAIAYALQITGTLNWLVRMSAAVETNIVAVERIKEYSEIQQEAPYEVEDTRANEEWPDKGVIEFDGYQTRYREGLDLVLDGITCRIEPGEKIGIVGRTGAGKSTLTLALFRIIEPVAGSIHIDGLDISKLGLFDLRSRLTIIPQDPVLFSGALRLNLDPFQLHTDGELWKVLELANLRHFVKGLQGGLQYEVVEGGENLSVGQRQQICLTRALLRRTRILVLDEATASVDLETDNLIQQTIRSEFAGATVLTIAHRLKTIMDSTRILVLHRGTIKEFDTPDALLRNHDSIFYSMAKDAGVA